MCSKELLSLACGPRAYANSYSAGVVNGVRFMVESRDKRRTTQNSGVSLDGGNDSMYYGVLEDIVELTYLYEYRVVVFKCKWFRIDNRGTTIRCVKKDNMTSILTSQEWCKDDKHILSFQAEQIFYLEDLSRPQSWKVVQEVNHRHIWNREIILEHEADVVHGTMSSDTVLDANFEDLTITSLGNQEEPTSVEIDQTQTHDGDFIDEEDDDDDFIDDEDGDDEDGEDEYGDDEDVNDIVGDDEDDDDEDPRLPANDTYSSDEQD